MWYHIQVGWTLQDYPVTTFKRNPLATVVVQLRFHPILKINEHYADVQDRLRGRFPRYQAVEAQAIEMNFDAPSGPVASVKSQTVHQFLATNEPTVATLDPSSVSIEYSAHKQRETLISDFSLALSALLPYAPVPTRLGLRYVNILPKETFKHGSEFSWSGLLSPDFAQVPAGLAAVDPTTNYLAEVTAPRTPGKMTVRYGVLPEPGNLRQHFRLDIDRFEEGGVDLDKVQVTLDQFAVDIYHVFRKAAGPALIEWMEGKS